MLLTSMLHLEREREREREGVITNQDMQLMKIRRMQVVDKCKDKQYDKLCSHIAMQYDKSYNHLAFCLLAMIGCPILRFIS